MCNNRDFQHFLKLHAGGVGQTCLRDIDGVDNGQLGAVHIDEGDVEGARLGRRQRQGQVHEGVKLDRGEVALRADQRGLVQPLHRVTRAHASENLLPVPFWIPACQTSARLAVKRPIPRRR